MFLHVLLLTRVDPVPKERGSKKNLVSALGSGSGKVVFTLLIEVIIFHVRFITIHIQKLGLQGLVLRFFGSA